MCGTRLELIQFHTEEFALTCLTCFPRSTVLSGEDRAARRSRIRGVDITLIENHTRLVTSQGSRWWLGLTVNQFAAGSIPACGAVARSGVGFQRLTVNEFVAGSIPVGHPRVNHLDGESLWEGSLIVYQVAAGSTPVAIALQTPHSTTG